VTFTQARYWIKREDYMHTIAVLQGTVTVIVHELQDTSMLKFHSQGFRQAANFNIFRVAVSARLAFSRLDFSEMTAPLS
jgi:hypothetical protein